MIVRYYRISEGKWICKADCNYKFGLCGYSFSDSEWIVPGTIQWDN